MARCPISGPGSRCVVPAQRAPSPVPDSSLTTNTSTGPSRALVPELQVIVASALCPPGARPRPRSRSRSSPGSSARAGTSGGRRPRTTPPRRTSYDDTSGRRSTAVGPWSGQTPPSLCASRVDLPIGVGQRGHSVRSGMGPRSRGHGPWSRPSAPPGQEFQRSTTGVSCSHPSTDTVAVSRRRCRPSETGSSSQRAARARRLWP